MSKRIELQIFPDGRVQAQVQGIKGKACTDYIRILEEILEAETVDSDYTPEYYETEDVTIKQEQTEQQVQKLDGK